MRVYKSFIAIHAAVIVIFQSGQTDIATIMTMNVSNTSWFSQNHLELSYFFSPTGFNKG